MKKSFVAFMVTIGFVLYSLYQRTVATQAAAFATSTTGNTFASSVRNSPGGNAAPSAPNSSQPGSTDPSQTVPSNSPSSGSGYRNGTYTGAAADAFYGSVQVQVTIANGKLTNIQFLQWPNDRMRSVMINQQALPMLTQEAIQAQSANVNMISGATDSSMGFMQSLQSALSQAMS